MPVRGNHSTKVPAYISVGPVVWRMFLEIWKEIEMAGAQLGAGRTEVATEAAQSAKGCAEEILGQSRRLQNIVYALDEALCKAGLKERTPDAGKDEAVDPADMRWTLNATNTNVRVATNLLEELVGIVDRELT